MIGLTREEIAKILTKCDERKCVIVLTLSSTEMRVGALAELRMKHVKRVDNLYQFTLYPGTKDQHVTFCTLECASAIDSYLEFRKRYGERITDSSPFIRNQFDKADQLEGPYARSITTQGLGMIMHNLLIDAGLRIRAVAGQKYKRQEVMAIHGFRKYFATTLSKATKNAFMVETLLGHDTGLVGTYNKPTDEDKRQFYESGMDALTINDEHRLKRQVQEKSKENDVLRQELETVIPELLDLKKTVGEIKAKMPALDKESEQAILLEACRAEIELRASSMPKTCPGCGHTQHHNHKRNLEIIKEDRENKESVDLHTQIKAAVRGYVQLASRTNRHSSD
jgi:integrase